MEGNIEASQQSSTDGVRCKRVGASKHSWDNEESLRDSDAAKADLNTQTQQVHELQAQFDELQAQLNEYTYMTNNASNEMILQYNIPNIVQYRKLKCDLLTISSNLKLETS